MIAKWLSKVVFAVAMLPAVALSQEHGHKDAAAPYAGWQARDVKGLSQQDIKELQSGGGWGLALPAELNGQPGPAHLLELRDELGLSVEQVEAISAIYKDMRAAAISAGERFIQAEAALSDAFAGSNLSDKALRDLLAKAEEARTELRYIHLSRHLSTPALLSKRQIKQYSVLRGYADDPCEQVPEGHDASLWRRHNGCE